MTNTLSLTGRSANYVRWYGAIAILGSILFMIGVLIFLYTHGTQSEAQHRTLIGLRGAQYAKVYQPTVWLSFLLGVIGVNAVQTGRAKQLGKAGFITSAVGYGLGVLSWISQTWIVDPDQHFESAFVQGGFLLWLLAILIQTVGMTLFGFALLQAKVFPRWNASTLLIGLLFLPINLFLLFVFERSDGSFLWSLIYISAVLPYALCWILLGISIWSYKFTA